MAEVLCGRHGPHLRPPSGWSGWQQVRLGHRRHLARDLSGDYVCRSAV